MEKLKLTYQELAFHKGIVWLGTEQVKASEDTEWQCLECGHQWQAKYRNISRIETNACPECRKKALRLNEKAYHSVAKERNALWLGPHATTQKKTNWKCLQCGHEWQACYSSLKHEGTACPKCGIIKRGLSRRLNNADYYKIAAQRELEWLGGEGKDITTEEPTSWRCKICNFQWEATYECIRASVRGCPSCAGHMRKEPEDYHALAKTRGFKWVGDPVFNNQTKTEWECEYGHRWLSTYGKIYSGHGCHTCNGGIRLEDEDYHEIAAKRNLEWLGPSVKNNSTHSNWRCLICGHEYSTSYASLSNGAACPECGRRRTADSKRLQSYDYHTLAKTRNLVFLGGEHPLTTQKKVTWECRNCGFIWRACYGDLYMGSGCPVCAREAAAEKRRKYTPIDYEDLANGRGYRWIGKYPLSASKSTKWECLICGYQWRNSYANITRGSGCPACSKRAHKEKEDYRELASSKGLRWLGKDEVANIQTKTEWICNENQHWFISTYAGVSRLVRCPQCRDYVNGVLVSNPQRVLAEQLDGELNVMVEKYYIDIALYFGDKKLAIEYDGGRWHDIEDGSERIRDRVLINNGWKILHIRAGSEVPNIDEVREKVTNLLHSEKQIGYIVYDEWYRFHDEVF